MKNQTPNPSIITTTRTTTTRRTILWALWLLLPSSLSAQANDPSQTTANMKAAQTQLEAAANESGGVADTPEQQKQIQPKLRIEASERAGDELTREPASESSPK